ncbi:Fatty-acid-binding protein 2 [Hibiscus syriacus]|uniref:Fatty-acid-binding protein 2 n=1 Tax=Hibiscus syriacus TaxID=106335 RepID=A0A6A3CRH8_HIBSY|nr:Fatty-acid-binding protein 2 [Hibiscus syriacus]
MSGNGPLAALAGGYSSPSRAETAVQCQLSLCRNIFLSFSAPEMPRHFNMLKQRVMPRHYFPKNPFSCYSLPARFVDMVAYALPVVDDDIPITYLKAIQSLKSDKWKSVMDEEMQSLQNNDTWKLAQLPKGKREIGCKWVFAKKDGSHSKKDVRYKARLVAKGYAQKERIDNNEVFSPVVKHSSIRILLALVAQLNLELAQHDVKTIFLHSDLEEEIYMTQPEGYKDGGCEKWVCKLNKSLYGLKQSPRKWYKRFDSFMRRQKYTRRKYDHCVYLQKLKDRSFIYLLLTGIEFPTILVLVDIHQYSVCQKLGAKYASIPVGELNKQNDFYQDHLREDIGMTVRLVVNCNGMKANTVRDAFEKSLRARLVKRNPNTDYLCLSTFGSYFSQDIPLPAGTIINFQRTTDGQLITKRAFFDMYIGDFPVSEQAKVDIGRNVTSIIRRC